MAEPHADEANQSEHLWVSCPKCMRQPENPGGHIWAGGCSVSIAASTSAPAPPTILGAKEQQLERTREQLQQATALHDELAVVRLENARLRAAVAQLSSQVADGGRREDELWSELQENRIHLQETGAQCASSVSGSIEARAREIEELRTERDRLAAGQQGWQDQLDAARAQLEQELQTFHQETKRLTHQLESLGREPDTSLGQVESLVRERDTSLEQVESLRRERDTALEQVKSLGRERDAALLQVASLVQERDRLVAIHADDSQRHAKSLEALRHDLELARSSPGLCRKMRRLPSQRGLTSNTA